MSRRKARGDGGTGSGMEIGNPIVSSTANRILFSDNSNDLAQSNDLRFGTGEMYVGRDTSSLNGRAEFVVGDTTIPGFGAASGVIASNTFEAPSGDTYTGSIGVLDVQGFGNVPVYQATIANNDSSDSFISRAFDSGGFQFEHGIDYNGEFSGITGNQSGRVRFVVKDMPSLQAPENTSGANVNDVLRLTDPSTGETEWAAGGVAGSNTEIQFNNSGSFGADSEFRYLGSGILALGNTGAAGSLRLYDDATGQGTINFANGTDFIFRSGSNNGYLIGNGNVLFAIKPSDVALGNPASMNILGANHTGTAGNNGGDILIQGGTTASTSLLPVASSGAVEIKGGDIITAEGNGGRVVVKGSSVVSGLTDIAAGNLFLQGGAGTGTGAGGEISFQVAPAGVSGSAPNAYVTPLTIQGNGIMKTTGLPAYDDDADAGSGGLTAGDMYQTTGSGAAPLNVAGILMIKQ